MAGNDHPHRPSSVDFRGDRNYPAAEPEKSREKGSTFDKVPPTQQDKDPPADLVARIPPRQKAAFQEARQARQIDLADLSPTFIFSPAELILASFKPTSQRQCVG